MFLRALRTSCMRATGSRAFASMPDSEPPPHDISDTIVTWSKRQAELRRKQLTDEHVKPYTFNKLSTDVVSVPATNPDPFDRDHRRKPAIIDPLKHPDYFNLIQTVSLHQMFEAKVHVGHKVGTLHQNMLPHLLGERLGVCIIDLDQTQIYLHRALNFLAHIAYRRGVILFVSNDRPNRATFEATAAACGEFAHTRRWMPSNFLSPQTVFGTEIRLPDCIVMVSLQDSTFEQHEVIREAAKLAIPVVGVTDTNVNPCLITYPIPGNDDTPSSVNLFLNCFKQAILTGKNRLIKDRPGKK